MAFALQALGRKPLSREPQSLQHQIQVRPSPEQVNRWINRSFFAAGVVTLTGVVAAIAVVYNLNECRAERDNCNGQAAIFGVGLTLFVLGTVANTALLIKLSEARMRAKMDSPIVG